MSRFLQLMSNKEVPQFARLDSCPLDSPPGSGKLMLAGDPATLSVTELQATLVDDCDTKTEHCKGYESGGYFSMTADQRIGRQKQNEVLRKVGYGKYSTVWMVKNYSETKSYIAIKISRAMYAYEKKSINELEILKHIKDKSCEGAANNRSIRAISYFKEPSVYSIRICTTFELMSSSLGTILRKSDYGGMEHASVRIILKQVLEGVLFLHNSCQIIHSNLKPDNILIAASELSVYKMAASNTQFKKSFVSAPEWKEFVQLEGAPASVISDPDGENKQGGKSLYFINPNVQIKIADFGNSFFEDEIMKYDSSIQIPAYQALEVLILADISYPIDIWSIGCITFELCVGKLLFDLTMCKHMSHSEYHLVLIWKLLGNIPKQIALGGIMSLNYFDITGRPTCCYTEFTYSRPLKKLLIETYKWQRKNATLFANLIYKLIEPNPKERSTAAMALKHKWLNK